MLRTVVVVEGKESQAATSLLVPSDRRESTRKAVCTVVREGPDVLGAKRTFREDLPEKMPFVSAKLDQQPSLCITATDGRSASNPGSAAYSATTTFSPLHPPLPGLRRADDDSGYRGAKCMRYPT